MTEKTRRKVYWITACLVLLALVSWTYHRVSRADAEHARFYKAGRSLNGFLKAYCGALSEARMSGDPSPVLALYDESYRSPGRGRWHYVETPAQGGSDVLELRAADRRDYDRTALGREVTDYLAGIADVEASWCKIDLVEEVDDREPPQAVRMTVKYVLDGTDAEGRRFQDRHFYRWHLRKTGAPNLGYGWRVTRDELVHGVRVVGDGEAFESLDLASIGVDFVHRRDPNLAPLDEHGSPRLAYGVMQYASGGVAVADADGDDLPDLFFGDGVAARFYRNLGPDENGTPRFEDVTEAAGLGGLGSVHTALFADFDGDGDRDLFVGRYSRASRLFENMGEGAFADRSAESGVDVTAPVSSATLLDYDRDGDLDVYLGVYGDAFREIPRLPFYATNGEANRLLRNDGELRFTDVTKQAGVGDTGWSLAVAAADYDGDGYVDLSIANDFGRKTLYRNRGDGTFEDRAQAAGVLDFSGGMGLAWGDYDDDGDLDLYTSNIKSNQRWYGEDVTVRQYLRNVLRTRWAILDAPEYWRLSRLVGGDWKGLGQQIGEGNSLFENAGDGTFVEHHENSRTHQAGWGWSVAFLDYDNDTDLDIYAANGWISNTPETDL